MIYKKLFNESIVGKRPYWVYYDEENQVWLIRGTGFGVPYAIIQASDGRVLLVGHSKF